ncbi:MAG: hypothetical protein WCD79_15830 [Chthoniobacteraceae bacterium]
MANEWEIKGRAEKCAVTEHLFQDGEYFYTLLFHDKAGFRRMDLSEEAWQQRNDNMQPFSFWRSKFEPPPPAAPEALEKETAEDLLRRYMEDGHAQHANARYILSLMLERKRILKQIEAKDDGDGRILIYEHVKTGEVFVIPEPQLKLDELAAVQNEVAGLLK